MNLLKFVFFYHSLCLLELMTENSVLCLFVKEVKYPELTAKNLNSDYCGLTSVPIVSKIDFPKNCFINIRDNITVVIPIIRQEQKSIESRMYNAKAADPNEAPWAVLLKEVYWKRAKKTWDFGINVDEICGGSLITFEWILTAAHCLDENEKIWVDVYADLSRGNVWSSPGQIRMGVRQKSFFRHDLHDIALIKLPRPFTETKHNGRFSINTICLPQKTRYSNEEVENAVMFSAGKIEIPNRYWDFWNSYPYRTWRGWAKNLMKGKFIIQPYKVCDSINRISKKYRKAGQFWDKKLCANTTMSGVVTTCPGDSGSGLVQYTKTRAILFGVLNGAIYQGKAVCDDRVEYPYWAAVSVHIDWILHIIRNN